MKYSFKRSKEDKNFKPFSVTLTFETKEEYKDFHDLYAIRIDGNAANFRGDTYSMGRMLIDGAAGEVK